MDKQRQISTCKKFIKILIKNIYLIYAPIIYTLKAYTSLLHYIGLQTTCIFKLLTTYSCPFCGLTRATEYLVKFNVIKAFEMYPLWPLIYFDIFVLTFTQFNFVNKLYKSKWFWIISILLIIIVYIIRLIWYAPNPPMDRSFELYN